MSVTITHGKNLRQVYSGEQAQYCDIEPVDGERDYVGTTAVLNMIRVAAANGIETYQWPFYPGEYPADISLEEIRQLCKELANDLIAIDPAVIEQNALLSRIAHWLSESQVFVMLTC